MKSLSKTKFFQLLITNYQLLAILLLAAIVRFGGLTWCFPYTPHPDEWNMARAVTQLNWREGLNPHFFAYGQFPLYLSYFSAIIYNLIPWIKINTVTIQEAVFFLRFWSAFAGVGTVYLVYLVTHRFLTPTTHPRHTTHNPQPIPLIAALLAVFTPGLIQISHFGTTESLLSYFFLLILLFSFKILEKPKLKYYILTGIILGLAIGTKISALAFGFPVFLVFAIQFAQILKKKDKIKKIFFLFLKNFSLLTVLFLHTLLSSPYLILAFKDSRGTLVYETSVAAGQTMVFYTRQFIQTTSVLFQIQKIFPYALGWPLFILGTLGLILVIVNIFKKTSKNHLVSQYLNILVSFSFVFYFLSQAFLFTKWTRFMSPIFAFFPIFAVIFLNYISSLKKNHLISLYLNILISILVILPGIVFTSVYFSPDIRFTASNWIFKNIPSNSKILFDTGNVVDIPIFSPSYPSYPPFPSYSTVSFDFYNLDENYELFPKLLKYLEMSDYIFVPSRRVFFNHQRLSEKFPLTAKYYELLFSGKLGFMEVRKFEPFYSKIFKDEKAEETFSVFDHPTIRIYKKDIHLKSNEYENLFMR